MKASTESQFTKLKLAKPFSYHGSFWFKKDAVSQCKSVLILSCKNPVTGPQSPPWAHTLQHTYNHVHGALHSTWHVHLGWALRCQYDMVIITPKSGACTACKMYIVIWITSRPNVPDKYSWKLAAQLSVGWQRGCSTHFFDKSSS